MVTNTHQLVIEGMEGLLTDLREVVCDCGCGETFYQKRVGRVRKYVNEKHKRAAAARRKANDAEMFTEWLVSVVTALETKAGCEWAAELPQDAYNVLQVINEDMSKTSAFMAGLRELERIQRGG